jgi:ABC-2 type transport system ATP-binding protein
LRRADAGEIWIAARSGPMAVCPNTPAFEPWLTAAEVVGQSRGLVSPARRRAPGRGTADPDLITKVLAEVGLTGAARRRVGGFSRGMTQRPGLAVALALDPERVADHIGVLDHGRLLFQGPMHALIEAYRQPAWEIRVRGPVAELAAQLERADWVTSVQAGSDGWLRVAGEQRGGRGGAGGSARRRGGAACQGGRLAAD